MVVLIWVVLMLRFFDATSSSTHELCVGPGVRTNKGNGGLDVAVRLKMNQKHFKGFFECPEAASTTSVGQSGQCVLGVWIGSTFSLTS